MILNERIFLRLIMWCEGTDKLETKGISPYSIRFGYETPHISNFADHPFNLGIKSTKGSNAAGAFQFMPTTWNELKQSLKLTDFNTSSQNLGAIALIKRRNAYNDVLNGNWSEAVKKCSLEWASMPYNNDLSYYNTHGKAYHLFGGTPQPTKTLSSILAFIQDWKDKGYTPTEIEPTEKKNFCGFSLCPCCGSPIKNEKK